MNRKQYDVVIIGSGLSGIVAANNLADHNLNLLLLDENIHIGGQLLRKLPERLGSDTGYQPDKLKRIGFRFVDRIKHNKIRILNRTKVLAVYPESVLLIEEDGKRVSTIETDIVLFATGAREKFLPFKGWTLPGVISTGAAQILMKTSGILPSKEILIGGSGVFLFAIAYEILKNNGRVLSVLEQNSMIDKLSLLSQFLHQFSKFSEGGRFVSKIFLSGVPVRHRTRIIEARGEKHLEKVVTVRMDRKGSVVEGSETIYNTNSLAIGYGFTPNIELPQLAGCELEYEGDKGGWIVKVKDDLETTVENMYAAGEITGIAGALKSINEGRISALSILNKLGKMSEDEFSRQLRPLKKERGHHLAFGKYFNSLCKTPEEAITSIPEETVICRCEDVRMGDIKKAILNGHTTTGAIKKATRIGMGACQGRICGPVLYDIVSAFTKISPNDIPLLSVRPPVKPVSIGSFI